MKVQFKICKLAKKVESAGLKTQESIQQFLSRSEESTNIHVDTCWSVCEWLYSNPNLNIRLHVESNDAFNPSVIICYDVNVAGRSS